jgi:hypothetical protein
MRPFFNGLGILFQHSCPATPQQNGVVERKHHRLLNVARALRFQACLPLQFWGGSILTTAYIINRLPTPILSKASPYEKLHNTIPTYHHMKVFYCLCYATIITPHTNLILEHANIFLWVILWVKRHITFMISQLTRFSLAAMSLFMNLYSPSLLNYKTHSLIIQTPTPPAYPYQLLFLLKHYPFLPLF